MGLCHFLLLHNYATCNLQKKSLKFVLKIGPIGVPKFGGVGELS